MSEWQQSGENQTLDQRALCVFVTQTCRLCSRRVANKIEPNVEVRQFGCSTIDQGLRFPIMW